MAKIDEEELEERLIRRLAPLLAKACAPMGRDFTGLVRLNFDVNLNQGGLSAVKISSTMIEMKG